MVESWLRASWVQKILIAGWSRRAGPSPIASIAAYTSRTKSARTLRASASGREGLSCRPTGEPLIDDTDHFEVGRYPYVWINTIDEAIWRARRKPHRASDTIFSPGSLIYDLLGRACPFPLMTTRKTTETSIAVGLSECLCWRHVVCQVGPISTQSNYLYAWRAWLPRALQNEIGD